MSKLSVSPFLVSAVLLAGCLLAGCPIYGSSDGDPPVCAVGCPGSDAGTFTDAGPGGEMCRTNGDCQVGFYCGDGQCEPSSTCSDDSECDTGFLCDFRGTCVPEVAGACRGDADCTAAQICVKASAERARTFASSTTSARPAAPA